MSQTQNQKIEKALQFAEAYCLDAVRYYNELMTKHALEPHKREVFLSWSQSKQDDLIEIAELRETLLQEKKA